MFQESLQGDRWPRKPSGLAQVSKPAHSLVCRPFPIAGGKPAGKSLNGFEPPLAVVVRDVDTAISESNNICTTIPCQIHNESRVFADFPPLLDTEVAKNELDRLECTVTVVVCDPHPFITEPNDVPPFVTGQVGNETRMLVDLPSLIDSKIVDNELCPSKNPISLVQRNVHASITATDYIDPPVSGQVCDETGVSINAPAIRAVAEGVDDGLSGRESSVSVVTANEDAMLSEPYDIWKAISGDVTKEAQVAVEAPTSSDVEGIERCISGTELTIAIVLGNNDPTVSKSYNVASTDASNVG